MTERETPFQVRLRQRTKEGFEIIEFEDQPQRVKLRVRIDHLSTRGGVLIAPIPGYTYTCREIAVSADGTIRDEVVPC